MSVKTFLTRFAVLGTLTAAASTALMTGTASAASEKVCSSYYCNTTNGTANYVTTLVASRNSPLVGKYGYFNVYGPNGFNLTGRTSTESRDTFAIRKSFDPGSLLCLRFFESVGGGAWKQRGNAVCTTTPVG
ncbi:hypothetical protein [Amycolatopsis orientalis]|uniref:hypothetical protein n=1 Tax=Amycolatopsis orientalis TaxID=31958 RepID=UPI000416F873|nr:hypothetical protein [Amycolatopsis orientalis]